MQVCSSSPQRRSPRAPPATPPSCRYAHHLPGGAPPGPLPLRRRHAVITKRALSSGIVSYYQASPIV
eukprot:1004460-Prorocentrum_minimum.AAC.1